MILNHLKQTLRLLFKEKRITIINIFGLSISLACALLMLLWVDLFILTALITALVAILTVIYHAMRSQNQPCGIVALRMTVSLSISREAGITTQLLKRL